MSILITGATGAIGKAIACALASNGNHIILACRNRKKGESVANDLRSRFQVMAEVVSLDLSDSASVREAARELSSFPIEAVINNAGVMNATYILDKDGHEDTLNVNYYNTRLLTELLLPNLREGAHIVFTTSATRSWFPFQRIKGDIIEKEFSRMKAYALSKKLITAYALHLADELKDRGIMVNCADPGVVDTPMLRMGKWYDRLTDIFFRPLCLSPEKGAKGALNAVSTPLTARIFTSPSGSRPIHCPAHALTLVKSH